MTVNVELFLFVDNKWQPLDINDNENFPITRSIAEIQDISKRNTTFSKTLIIPGTKNNEILLNYIFDIASVSKFNTNKKVRCTLLVDTTPELLDGTFQLNKINTEDNIHFTYECNIVDDTNNLVKDIGDSLLDNLGLKEISHKYISERIVHSWTQSSDHGYYYGLADYGTGLNVNNMTQVAASSTINSGLGMTVSSFKPLVYGKKIWDTIFDTYGYKQICEFCDNDEMFNNFLVLSGTKLLNSPTYSLYNSFRASLTQTLVYKIGPNTGYLNFTQFANAVATLGPAIQLSINGAGWPYANLVVNTSQNSIDVLSTFGQYINAPVTVDIIGRDFSNYTNWITSRLRFDDETTYPNSDPSSVWNNTIFQYTAPLEPISIQFSGNLVIDRIANNIMYSAQALNPIANGFLGFGSPTASNGAFLDLMVYRSTLPAGVSFLPAAIIPIAWIPSTLAGMTSSPIKAVNGLNYEYMKPGENLYTFKTPLFDQPGTPLSYQSRLYGLQPGETVWFKLVMRGQKIAVTGQEFGYTIKPTTTSGAFYKTELYANVNPEILPGQTIPGTSLVPKNFKQIDFITSVIKMFNLFIEPKNDGTKTLYIEPRDEFYLGGKIKDWTKKIDINSSIEQELVSSQQGRQTLLTYKQDKDYYNTQYNTTYQEIYGQHIYFNDNEFTKETTKIEPVFASTPQSQIILANSYVIPKIWKDANGSSIEFLPRVFLKKSTGIAPVLNQGFNFRFEGVNYPYYPYIGHFNDPFNGTLDINFGQTKALYYNGNTITNNNLYSLYYEKMLQELTDKDSRLVTVRMKLTPQDINTFRFNDRIYLEGISSGTNNYFKVNKINYDPTVKGLFTVELLKSKDIPKNKFKVLGAQPNLPNGGVNPNQGQFRSINMGIGNDNGSENTLIVGNENIISDDTFTSVVFGSQNAILSSNGIITLGSNNFIDTVNNSVIIGSGLAVNNSMSGQIIFSSQPVIYFNYIDAGLDVIVNPFDPTQNINYMDASKDVIRQIGGNSIVNLIDSKENII